MMWSRITRIARVQRAYGFAVWACLATALLAFAPAARAAEFTFKGQKVEYENAEYKEIVDAATGDTLPVLIFRENGWFKPSKTATGRALVVGGGGAGGYGTLNMMNPGGGGGGGEVKDQGGLAYLEEVIQTVTVGAGGAQTTAAGNGADGQPSTIANETTTLVIALGGGGGGANKAGNGGDTVATGGGGSGNGKLGGVGALGAEHKGGKAGAVNRSGGGGGAGGAGDDSSTAKVGNGGAGVTVNAEIWVPATLAIPSSFGGGGGGGAAAATGNGTGKDGGGNGGRQAVKAGDGDAYTGGGGGGGGLGTAANKAFYGGAGGSGIVVIRFEDIEATINWVEIPVKIGGQTTEGKVFVDENSSWRWVGNDLVIAYSNTTIKGGLRFFDPENPDLPPVWANARILAIGGGGGGGMIDVQTVGAGGGGGAGGFVEREGLVFDNQVEYQITVGAGGAGGMANEEVGKNGKDSFITTNGINLIEAAIGGGGGGAHSPGETGGSGGGGSRGMTKIDDSYDRAGGEGFAGQGFAGGAGDENFRAAGGGGAGGPGYNAKIGADSGRGGQGKASDITGTSVVYAGGGGGASVNANDTVLTKTLGGRGGEGGGGNGAGVDGGESGKEMNPVPAQNGVDGLGGGGGGGVSYKGAPEVAGSGGSGVVIIRLSGFVVRSVPVPKTTNYVFDGHSKTGVVEFYAYELTGTPVADNADVYTVYAKIKPQYSFEWDDATGGQGERKLTWHIAQMPVTVPSVTPSYVYDAEEHYAVDPTTYAIDADGYCHLTHAGLDHAYCKVEGNAQTEANPKGESYTVTISLSRLDLRGNPATNYVWRTPSTMADQLRKWRITQASNAIVGLDYPCRNLARLAKPLECFTCDWPKKASIGDNVVVEYRPVDDEEGWVAWGSATSGGPRSKGSYVIRVKIPETDNWQGDSAEMTFGTWDKLSDIFSDQLEFKLSGFTGLTPLTDFPVPVIIREPERDGFSVYSGFEYMRAGADGHDIQFFSSSGDPIPHEVERWDVYGDSLVWVKVPSAKTNATITMCWKRNSDIYLRPYDGGAVWRDNYEAVWHMSEINKNKRIPDATDNGHDAYFTGDADWERLEEKDGARVMGAIYLKRGDLFVENDIFPSGTTSNKMTYTGWYKSPDYVTGTTMDKGYKIFAGLKYDATSITEAKTMPGWALRMYNAANRVMLEATGTEFDCNGIGWDLRTGWGLIGAVFGTTVATGTDAKLLYGQTTISSTPQSGAAYYMNGADKPLQLASDGFCVDEVRLSKKVLTDAWIQEAAYTVTRARSYCVPDLIHVDCELHNDGQGLICDWWEQTPGLSKTIWHKGEPKATFSPTPKYKDTGANYSHEYVNVTSGTSYGTSLPDEVGFYRVTFDHQVGDRDKYRPNPYSIDFYIIERQDPSRDLGGSTSGRVLLMNADNNTLGPVTNQGWCAQSDAGETYWRILGGGAGTNNIMPGTEFELVRSADTNRLWYLKQCRQGNTFPTNDTQRLNNNFCYLPPSSTTALAITNEDVKATRSSSGWLMLRNTTDAAVYSPCYTNGIGTIYFDALNQRSVADKNNESYKLVLEIATATVEGLPPTDANSWTEEEPGQTNWYGRLKGMWQSVVMYPAHFGSTTVPTDEPATTELALKEITGGSNACYYRIHAPVNLHTPVRFRIRRTSVDESAVDAEGNVLPDDGFVLMDNLIVSVPSVYADLQSYGTFDPTLPGERAVGFAGAFDVPFPSPADTANIFGRCRVVLPPGSSYEGMDPGEYISLAQMFYRRRYLSSVGEWSVAVLNGAGPGRMRTQSALSLPALEGDLEYYFVSLMKAPYYEYVDYTGRGAPVAAAAYTEEIMKWESHLDEQVIAQTPAGRLASGGTDWFVRIREGQSDWEQMSVEIVTDDPEAVALRGVYPMKLVGDHMWRAMVRVPEEAEGRCGFHFRGFNCRGGDDPDLITKTNVVFGLAKTLADAVEIPNNGQLEEAAAGNVPFVIDHAAGYLEFRLSDQLVYQVGRAEYQDFNAWNDAHTPADHPWFRADTTYTNSVDAGAMKTETAPIVTWPLFSPTNEYWSETFHQTDYAPTPGNEFDKDVFHLSYNTPNKNGWRAEGITFVSENLVSAATMDQKNFSGMAGKLAGAGAGLIEFTASGAASSPAGLETISLRARLAQDHAFDAFSYSKSALMDSNYMFFSPVTMSHAAQNSGADALGDMAVGASVSLVGYYSSESGCYEFRAERLYTKMNGDTEPALRLSVWKWSVEGFAIVSKRLAYRDFNAAPLWSSEVDAKTGKWTEEAKRKFYGMFISLDTEFSDPATMMRPKKTTIICGISDAHAVDPAASWETFNNDQPVGTKAKATFYGLEVVDESNPLGWGSYGVGSKDCPAQFVMPAHTDFDQPFRGTIKSPNANNRESTDGSVGGLGGSYFVNETFRLIGNTEEEEPFIDDRNDLANPRKWAVVDGRAESFTNVQADPTWKGLRAPTDLKQKLELHLREHGRTGEMDWTKVDSREVEGWGFTDLPAFDLRRFGKWDMRLKVSTDNNVGVVVDDIVQRRWQAPDINDPGTVRDADYSEKFIYSQAMVETNALVKSQWITLQPARGDASRPVSVRSPVLHGLGKFTFSYRDVDENAEVWLQVATNAVSGGGLGGLGGYNDSIKSKDLGEQQEIGEWLTVAKFSRNSGNPDLALDGKVGTKTAYLGWHNHKDSPISGVFRLFVPPAVVERAYAAATNATKVTTYGKITLTAISCTDEPGLSDRSWRALNLRTIGDGADRERRMYLADMTVAGGDGTGLSGALNNSWNDVEDNNGKAIDATDPQWRSLHPAIYSPTLKPPRPETGVGSVSLRARLYGAEGRPVTSGGGRIVLLGASSSLAEGVESWEVLCTNFVTSSTFTNFTWASNGKRVYKAIKFEVTEAAPPGGWANVDRVILDEIVIAEKVPPSIEFLYARPFRMDLFGKTPIADIMSPVEQPLAGESWGIQTKLSVQQLTDEIDVERGFEVSFSYYQGEEPWGYEQWKGRTSSVTLLPVGDSSNLVFRSCGERPETLVPPSDPGTTVQFMLKVRYWYRSGSDDTMTMTTWTEPSWFYPLDKNREHGYDAAHLERFSAYTVLDSVSPGRAWINEINWNDGPGLGSKAQTNQFVEICVPAGIDLKGWMLRVTEPNNLEQKNIALFGDAAFNMPSRKDPGPGYTNGYEFLVLKSPASTVRQVDGRPADGSWYTVDIGPDISGGTLAYNDPLQFELIRPSGIIEHQFVMDGTNEYSKWSWGAEYDGTNFMKKLDAEERASGQQVSPKRFWAHRDLAQAVKAGRTTCVSTGVVGGRDDPDVNWWPGGSNTWREAMAFTPGRINEGQVLPQNWFIFSNGTNSWIIFTTADGHIRQSIGGKTDPTIMVVVPEGQSTSVVYTVDNWYEAVIDETGRGRTVDGRRSFSYAVTPTGMVTVTATTQPQSELATRYGLTADNPYTSSIMRWLHEEYPDANAEDIRLARFKGLHALDSWSWMSLTDMYWLDIPPVAVTEEEKTTNGGTNWWFRGGISSFGGEQHVIVLEESGRESLYTNRQIVATLYMSNAVTHVAHAPQVLRGLDYACSTNYTGLWKSATFKVSGKLDLSAATDFLPFRVFIFDSGSFTGPDAEQPFSSTIDILDPFKSPIGRNYGWDKHPDTSAHFRWRINDEVYPYSIETLKADSTYKGK